MREIQMVDLKRQYQKIKPEIDAAIQDVLDSAAFIQGSAVKLFSEHLANYLNVRHVIPCANGTDALQIALMSLDLQPGDEVITPSFTYIATVEVVALLGLKPVFADVRPDTFTLDPESLEKAISPKTKAIIPVHLYGQSADMEPILEIAAARRIPVIEDNAQAMGSSYTFSDGTVRKTGAMGLIGCTSFFPSKNLGCYGDGGALFTQDDGLAKKLHMIANHGQSQRYYHERVGCNSRLDSIQAAVLNVKLPHLDEYNRARRATADFYDREFANHRHITIPFRARNSNHVFHQYTVLLDGVDRSTIISKLAERGIPSMLYYPVPCHQQKMFENRKYSSVCLKTTEDLQRRVLSLPIHTEMEEEERRYIAQNFLEIVQNAIIAKS